MNETLENIIGYYLSAMLVVDSLYLAKYHNGIWGIFVIGGIFLAVNQFYESSRSESLMDIGLGAFVGIIYSVGIVIVLFLAKILSVHYMVVTLLSQYRDNVFHFLPLFMVLTLALFILSFFLLRPFFPKISFWKKRGIKIVQDHLKSSDTTPNHNFSHGEDIVKVGSDGTLVVNAYSTMTGIRLQTPNASLSITNDGYVNIFGKTINICGEVNVNIKAPAINQN